MSSSTPQKHPPARIDFSIFLFFLFTANLGTDGDVIDDISLITPEKNKDYYPWCLQIEYILILLDNKCPFACCVWPDGHTYA